MRLQVVEHGGSAGEKAKLFFLRLVMRRRVPDIVRTLVHRADFFGSHMNQWTQAVMRGPSQWSVGERELFAAFTSRLNQCVF